LGAGSGAANEAARASTAALVEELDRKRAQLAATAQYLSELADELDEHVQLAAEQIHAAIEEAKPAAAIVLSGGSANPDNFDDAAGVIATFVHDMLSLARSFQQGVTQIDLNLFAVWGKIIEPGAAPFTAR